MTVNHDKAEKAIKMLLESFGVPGSNTGTKDTPQRVARMFAECLSGVELGNECLDRVFQSGDEDEPPDDTGIVMLRDIEFYSMCEHHLLPFSGVAHVAYLPREGVVVGLSKLARIVHVYARRLQLQERIGRQVADAIEEKLKPHGVAVILEAKHGCMSCRGVRLPGASMVTSVLRGAFSHHQESRAELFSLLSLKRS